MNKQAKKGQGEVKFTELQQFEIDHARKFGQHSEYVKLSDLNEYLFLDMLFKQLPQFQDAVKAELRELEASVENHLRYVKGQFLDGNKVSPVYVKAFLEDIRHIADFEDVKDWMAEAATHAITSPYVNLIAGVLAKLQVTNDHLNGGTVPEQILAYADVDSILHDMAEYVYETYVSDKDIQLNIRTGEFVELKTE